MTNKSPALYEDERRMAPPTTLRLRRGVCINSNHHGACDGDGCSCACHQLPEEERKRYDNRKSLQQGKPTERWEYVPKNFGLCVHPSLHPNYEIDLQSVVEGGEFEAWKWVEHMQKKPWVTPMMLWNLVALFRTLFSCIDRAEFEHVMKEGKAR